MTRFEELQNAYTQASEARKAYWADVMNAAQMLAKEFSEYLGVSPDYRVPLINYAPAPAVSIGWFNQLHQFEHRPFHNLPKEGDSLRFVLRLVFGTDGSGEIPIEKLTNLSLKKGEEPGVYVVKIHDDFEDPSYSGPSFQTLFEVIVKTALDKMVPSK